MYGQAKPTDSRIHEFGFECRSFMQSFGGALESSFWGSAGWGFWDGLEQVWLWEACNSAFIQIM